ncbi:MAG: ABC transporter ATP-binding protein [Clostridium sp.]|uniref:ABC transporter ATP-binding protein n=1 Tax=Clostridium sp. TaxID=1506 RepID=UPI002FC99AA2
MKEVINVSNVSICYGKHQVIQNLSLSIEEGEILGLLGPSGCGKTTLVKSIIGMKAPSSGSVHVLSVKMPSLSNSANFGYMAQSDALYEDLSAMDNLIFFGELYGIRGKALISRATELLTLVDLIEHKSKLVKDFSGGMKRRLSLAIALVHSPKILILDEPTVGVDPVLRQKFWAEFNRIKESGASIILTTHVMDETHKCDRLAMLREGNIIAFGKPSDIISSSGGQTIEDAFLFYSRKEQEA